VAWVETASLSFVARHDSGDAEGAARTLEDLEEFRVELEGLFETAPGDVSVVIHPRPLMLTLSAPWLPFARRVSDPAGRRYFAGWFASEEIHVLSAAALERRASGVPGSREALLRSPRHEYAHLALGAENPSLPPPFSLATFRRYVSMAWLCEGAATWLAGQVPLMRAAILRRLREGGRPQFPPAARDAWVLGGTVFALLERERGREACAELARSTTGEAEARRALQQAFGRPGAMVERDWSDYLAALTSG
jgi:hypothetical protein